MPHMCVYIYLTISSDCTGVTFLGVSVFLKLNFDCPQDGCHSPELGKQYCFYLLIPLPSLGGQAPPPRKAGGSLPSLEFILSN